MRGFIAPKWSLVHTFLTTNRGSGKRAEVAIEEVCKLIYTFVHHSMNSSAFREELSIFYLCHLLLTHLYVGQHFG
jgi:hypothetical protein